MNTEPIIQSKTSQKDKNKYHILMHIYGIQKDGTDEYLQGSNGDVDIENRLMDMVGGGESGTEREQHGNIHITICKRDSL